MEETAVAYTEPDPTLPEVPLVGGDVTEGLVRVGDTIRRPWDPHAPLVRAVLRHLETVGFDGAPRFLGVDARGREVLSFLPGQVAGRPRPGWFRDRERLASVARLLSRYHAAVASFVVPAPATGSWDPPGLPADVPELSEPEELLCHRDITAENVVFRDGVAVGLIDFDLARPGSRLLDVVNAVTHWGQLTHPEDRDPPMTDSEVFARCRVFVDAYALDVPGRERLADLAAALARRSWHLMKHRALVNGGGWRRMWDEGVGDVINRRAAWLSAERAAITAALVDGLPSRPA